MTSLEQLMQESAELIGAAHLAPDDDGTYLLQFDDRFDLAVRPLDNVTALLQSVIGHEPDTAWAADEYLRKVLTRSVIHFRQAAESVCLDPEDGRLLLQRRLPVAMLMLHEFQQALEQFVNRADEWSRFLTDDERATLPPPSMHLLMP